MPTESVPAVAAVLDWLRETGDLVLSAEARTYWPFLLASAAIAVGLWVAQGRDRHPSLRVSQILRRWGSASSRVDLGLVALRPIIGAVFAVPWVLTAYGVARAIVRTLDELLGVPQVTLSEGAVATAYTLVLFVAWDVSRFALHWAMHRVPALWDLHQVHHSAEVLTPLTLHRVHPIERGLYALRGVVVTGVVTGVFFHVFRAQAMQWELLGINVLGAGFNFMGGNLRHSHVRWGWGRLERVFISPAQHQLHHGRGAENRANYGTWLAVWDRWAGSWAGSHREAIEFGLDETARNHRPDSVIWALFDPLWGWGTRLRRRGRPHATPRPASP